MLFDSYFKAVCNQEEKKEITVQLLIVWFGVQISVFWFCQSQYDSDSTFDVAAVGMSVGAEVAHHRAT